MKQVLCAIAMAGAISFVMFGCGGGSSGGSGSTGTTISSETPDLALGSIQDAVAAIGSSLSTGSMISGRGGLGPMLSETECTDHGNPDGIAQSDERYPGVLTYCQVTVNSGSPDTVQGAFEMSKAIACGVRKAGVQYSGSPQTLTITVNSTCFPASMIADMPSSFEATVTGSSPASFNSHFDRGLIIEVPTMSIEFKMATSVSDSTIEFVTYEDMGTDKTGMTAGSLDRTTGEVRYEARMDRIDCSGDSSCGWNRHIRLYADLTMSGGEPGELQTLSLGVANTQDSPASGELVTASGALSTGIKARLWLATDGSSGAPADQTDFIPVANWVETVNSKCYTETSETAPGCGAGIGKFTSSTKFAMTGSELSPLQVFDGLTSSMSFTSVDLDADAP